MVAVSGLLSPSISRIGRERDGALTVDLFDAMRSIAGAWTCSDMNSRRVATWLSSSLTLNSIDASVIFMVPIPEKLNGRGLSSTFGDDVLSLACVANGSLLSLRSSLVYFLKLDGRGNKPPGAFPPVIIVPSAFDPIGCGPPTALD